MTVSISGTGGVTFNDLSVQNTAAAPQITTIGATVASSALTITRAETSLAFRSTTLGSGAVTVVTGTPANLVVPSTATLGTVSAVQSRIVVLALNNAGTLELAVVNIAGGNDLSETGVVSTTAIAGGSNTANVIYSTTARTSVAYRVVGYVESTQATAGTWATAPSTIQGVGGQALTAMSSLGYGQTWQDVTASRALSTTYYNTTGKPIFVIVGPGGNISQTITFTVNGVNVYLMPGSGSGIGMPAAVIVPAGASYSCTFSTGGLSRWTELR